MISRVSDTFKSTRKIIGTPLSRAQRRWIETLVKNPLIITAMTEKVYFNDYQKFQNLLELLDSDASNAMRVQISAGLRGVRTMLCANLIYVLF